MFAIDCVSAGHSGRHAYISSNSAAASSSRLLRPDRGRLAEGEERLKILCFEEARIVREHGVDDGDVVAPADGALEREQGRVVEGIHG